MKKLNGCFSTLPECNLPYLVFSCFSSVPRFAFSVSFELFLQFNSFSVTFFKLYHLLASSKTALFSA